MIDQYKYTWKMVKPLIPIFFLAAWAFLFEEKIWPDWENEEPIKIFEKSELQWEYEMDPDLAMENYRFEFVEFEGVAKIYNKDTLVIDNNIYCIMENIDSTLYKNIIGQSVSLKGRILSYNTATKKFRLDHCFIKNK
tara:strand:+ start:1166 stop:1576 length:411 start_codon:yes stop_codon:yes gene_type:complete